MHTRHTVAATFTVLAALFLASCGQNGQPQPPAPAGALLPAGLFLDAAPENPREIVEAKREFKEGDHVAIRGRIGGTANPFVNGRAIMTIIDLSLPTCADKPDDCCETPWDYCCETRAEIVAHAATIQVSAEGGGPLRTDLKGAAGLAPMKEVIVVGRVGKTASPTAFLVEAEGIYIVR